MVRKAIYKHATQVDTVTYPDDGSSPVGSNEWNEAPDAGGMLGFTPATATVTISTGNLLVTDSICVAAAETGTSDIIDTIDITNTSQYDLIYLFADTGDTITLTHTASPVTNGQVVTVSGSNETLSTTSPTILIRKGNYWYGYGGGVVNAINDIGDVTITTPADNEVLAYDTASTSWINQTVTEAGLASAVHTHSQSDVTNLTTDLAGKSPLAGNTSLVTTGTITTGTWNGTSISLTNGGTGATSQQAGIDALTAVSGATNEHVLTKDTATGNAIWKAASGGASAEVNSILQANSYTASNASPTTEGTDQVSIWVETIDTNNQGVYARIKKNGSYVNVQIA